MRLYISIPYKGDDKEFAERSIAAHNKYDAQDVRVITSHDVTDPASPTETMVGKRIEALLTCESAVFAFGWPQTLECQLEFDACNRYGIPYKTDVHI